MGGTVIVIVEPGGVKGFEITGAGDRIELHGPLLEIGRSALLVIGQVDVKPYFIRDQAPATWLPWY